MVNGRGEMVWLIIIQNFLKVGPGAFLLLNFRQKIRAVEEEF